MPWSIGQGRGFATTGSRLFANRAICREMTVAIRVIVISAHVSRNPEKSPRKG